MRDNGSGQRVGRFGDFEEMLLVGQKDKRFRQGFPQEVRDAFGLQRAFHRDQDPHFGSLLRRPW